MSYRPDPIVVTTGVGFTLHLFRLAADLISKASSSSPSPSSTAAAASATSAAERGESGGGGASRRTSTTGVFNGRLSLTAGRGVGRNSPSPWGGSSSHHRGGKGSNSAAASAVEESASASEVGGKNEENDEDGDSTTGGAVGRDGAATTRFLPPLSLALHLLLLSYFATACGLSAAGVGPESASFGTAPLGLLSGAAFLSVVTSLRDYGRSRYGRLQRSLSGFGCAVLLAGCTTSLSRSRSSSSSSSAALALDWSTLAAAIVYFGLTLIEIRAFPYPRAKSKDSKATLSRQAILTILRPYFWPDATATSAATNRLLSSLTWLCVALSKACNLTAPILLGRASTALAKGDYGTCIRRVAAYAAVMFAGTFFKESQSLVYLKVAQAAFVQLSEVSFRHLHSLSLDWHLRKKLGEVIRSMDRGIAACDILMKFLFLWLLPAIMECILVCVIFAVYFDYFPLSVSVFFFVFAYMIWTIVLTLWRKKFRKQVAKSDNDWHDKCTDSLINFETVKYFTAEEYEIKR